MQVRPSKWLLLYGLRADWLTDVVIDFFVKYGQCVAENAFWLTASFCKKSELERTTALPCINMRKNDSICSLYTTFMRFLFVPEHFFSLFRQTCNRLRVCFRPVTSVFPTEHKRAFPLSEAFSAFCRAGKRVIFCWLKCKVLCIRLPHSMIASWSFKIFHLLGIRSETNDSGAVGYAK